MAGTLQHLKAAWHVLKHGPPQASPAPAPAPFVSDGPDVQRVTPVARYESAYQFWHKRGYVPGALQDARFDADGSTRRELMRRSRHWEQNSAIIQRILDLFEEFTVGSHGLNVVPSSDNSDWNKAASEWWEGWSQSPARDNYLPLGQLQGMMARSWFVDGEIFISLTSDPSTGMPAIQLIESNRVETPWNLALLEGRSINDGVEIDEAGKPIAYQVRQTDAAAAYGWQMQVPGGQPGVVKQYTYGRVIQPNMLHLFEPVRPGLNRGLPMAYAVLNDCQDLYELQDLEMQAARDAARITNVMTTKTGEANVTNAFKNRWQVQSQDAAGNPVVKTVPQYFEITMGGETVYIMPGEDFKQFRSERPSVATQEYWNTLIGKVCIGTGIPRVLVIPYAIQGTVLRADIEAAAAYFRARSAIIGHTMHQLYCWGVSWAKDWDKRFRGLKQPANWNSVVLRPPRSLSVDVGYQTDALTKQMDAGFITQAEACNEMGKDWRQVQRQKAMEWQHAQELAEEFGVPVERIMEPPKPPVVPGFGPGNKSNGAEPAPKAEYNFVQLPAVKPNGELKEGIAKMEILAGKASRQSVEAVGRIIDRIKPQAITVSPPSVTVNPQPVTINVTVPKGATHRQVTFQHDAKGKPISATIDEEEAEADE